MHQLRSPYPLTRQSPQLATTTDADSREFIWLVSSYVTPSADDCLVLQHQPGRPATAELPRELRCHPVTDDGSCTLPELASGPQEVQEVLQILPRNDAFRHLIVGTGYA